jgi:hypothetical protein
VLLKRCDALESGFAFLAAVEGGYGRGVLTLSMVEHVPRRLEGRPTNGASESAACALGLLLRPGGVVQERTTVLAVLSFGEDLLST